MYCAGDAFVCPRAATQNSFAKSAKSGRVARRALLITDNSSSKKGATRFGQRRAREMKRKRAPSVIYSKQQNVYASAPGAIRATIHGVPLKVLQANF